MLVQTTVLKREAASRIDVEAVGSVVQIYIPRLKLIDYTIGGPVAHRRQPVGPKVQRTKGPNDQRKKNQDDRRLAADSVHIPSIFNIQARPNLTAFAKTLTPEALRYLYLGIDLGWTVGNCP